VSPKRDGRTAGRAQRGQGTPLAYTVGVGQATRCPHGFRNPAACRDCMPRRRYVPEDVRAERKRLDVWLQLAQHQRDVQAARDRLDRLFGADRHDHDDTPRRPL
jgi:hypothetical protein